MEKFFQVKEKGSTIRTEILAGLTTFMTMSYILMVNPGMFAATVLYYLLGLTVPGFYTGLSDADFNAADLQYFLRYRHWCDFSCIYQYVYRKDKGNQRWHMDYCGTVYGNVLCNPLKSGEGLFAK